MNILRPISIKDSQMNLNDHAMIKNNECVCSFHDVTYIDHCIISHRDRSSLEQLVCPQIVKTLGSTSIWYRSDTFVSDRYLIDVDQRVFAIWVSSNPKIYVFHVCCDKINRHGDEHVRILYTNGKGVLTHWGRENVSFRHFQIHFLELKWMNFAQTFTEVCP